LNNLIKMARTKSVVEMDEGTFAMKITGIPTEKESSRVAIGMMRVVLAYEAIENWAHEKVGGSKNLADIVAEARRELRIKSKYTPVGGQ